MLCQAMVDQGLGHSPPGIPPQNFPPVKNTNKVVEIEAGMIKQFIVQVEAGLME